MTNTIKDKITADINKAREEGQLRSEKIREILREAVSEAGSEFKEGSQEIRKLVKDALSAAIEAFQERGGEIKEEVTASIEGAIEGVSKVKLLSIAKNQSEVKKLQAQIDEEENSLQQTIDVVLVDIEETGKEESDNNIKSAIESAVNTIKDSEEMALLQKRYAQLKAQLAIVQANLAGRYGERYEEVKQHLDDAKDWYERAKKDPEVFTDKVDNKRQEFEDKLGEAGSAIAKKEKQLKEILQQLWKSLHELFQDK